MLVNGYIYGAIGQIKLENNLACEYFVEKGYNILGINHTDNLFDFLL